MASEADTLERIVPERLEAGSASARDVLRVHLQRYRFAASHARPGRLLDIACGVGYGTRLLADGSAEVKQALGVDLCEDALAFAREHYACDRVEYRQADAMHFEDPEGFDTIVSLETVEHLPDPARFIARLVGLLRPGGRLVASVPITPSVDLNPYHLNDFTQRSFRDLVAPHGLREIACLPQRQTVRLAEVLGWGSEGQAGSRLAELRPNLPGYYLRHPGALARRVWTTLRHGLANHYLTVVWQRDV